MTFTPGIPNTGQSLGFTKDPVRTNMAVLRTTISNTLQPNHIDVNSAGAGKHVFVQMPRQVAGAPNLTLSGEAGLITQGVTYPGPITSSELFFNRDGTNVAGIPTYFQMTGPSTIAANGSIYLFGGVILKWGSFLATGAQTFAGGAFPNNLWSLVVTSKGATPIVQYNTVTNAGFNVATFGGNQGFYIAIGN